MIQKNKLITAQNLDVQFQTDEGMVPAVSDVSFNLYQGEILGLVGESGSGKSVTARSLMQLNPHTACYGKNSKLTLHLENRNVDILSLKKAKELLCIRGDSISMIFQEPMASLAPAITIGKQMVEQLQLHRQMNKAQAKALSIDMLDRVGIQEPDKRFDQYAFELSGGMRQRAMIAMAISTQPQLLIADEPTTALDVTIQAQVLQLILDLVKEFGMGVLFITHDLGVIAEITDRVIVMKSGNFVEQGTVKEIICTPTQPYTCQLLDAIPKIDHLYTASAPPPLHLSQDSILSIQNLSVEFPLGRRLLGKPPTLQAVKNLSLEIPRGSFYGLVGESGSGKTTLGRSVLKAAPISNGQIQFSFKTGKTFDITSIKRNEEKDFRKYAQLIFQDPYSSLSPRMTVRDIIAEPLEVLKLTSSRAETDKKVREIAAKCHLNIEHLRRFPHAFSGGQRQRISIARALVCNAEFIVADESVSALDVSIQAEILDLLKSLQSEMGLTFLFISHDLSVVANVCDQVAVMYHGELVETGTPYQLFNHAQHPYTQKLLSAIPSLDSVSKR